MVDTAVPDKKSSKKPAAVQWTKAARLARDEKLRMRNATSAIICNSYLLTVFDVDGQQPIVDSSRDYL